MLRQERGFDTRVATYWQGEAYARMAGEAIGFVPDDADICSTGVVPVSRSADELFAWLNGWDPDIVVFDGEPGLLQVHQLAYGRRISIAMLNPSDVQNESIPLHSQAYFRTCFSSADVALVHGLWRQSAPVGFRAFHSIATILRASVLALRPSGGRRIVFLLGGGTTNARGRFVEDTASIAALAVPLSLKLPGYEVEIQASDKGLATRLSALMGDAVRVRLATDARTPAALYESTALVVARAGRNSISELLYLGIPAMLVATNDGHRGGEQRRNVEAALTEGSARLIPHILGEPAERFLAGVEDLLDRGPGPVGLWCPGNGDLSSIFDDIGV
jgi:hypothetical protein